MGPKDEKDPPKAGDLAVIERVASEVTLYRQAEQAWLGRVWRVPLGGLGGLVGGAAIIVLLARFVKIINPATAMVILLVTTAMGMIAGWRMQGRRTTLKAIALERARGQLSSGYDRDPVRAIEEYSENLDAINVDPGAVRTVAAAPASGMFSQLDVKHIVAARHAGKLVPVVGAGLALEPDVKGGFPFWRELPGRLLDECEEYPRVWSSPDDRTTVRDRILNMGVMTLDQRLGVFDLLKDKLGDHYRSALNKIFRPPNGEPGAAIRAVLRLDTQVVLTVGLDLLLDAAAAGWTSYTWLKAGEVVEDIEAGRKVLLKIRGHVTDVDSVVFTRSEFAAADQKFDYRRVLEHLGRTHTFLFIGFGKAELRDFEYFLKEHARTWKKATTSHFVLLKRRNAEADRELQEALKGDRVSVIFFDDESELVPFLADLVGA